MAELRLAQKSLEAVCAMVVASDTGRVRAMASQSQAAGKWLYLVIGAQLRSVAGKADWVMCVLACSNSEAVILDSEERWKGENGVKDVQAVQVVY